MNLLTIKSRWSIIYIEGSLVIISKIYCIFSLKLDLVLVNCENTGEMLHDAAFHLGFHCLQLYMLGSFLSTKG